MSAVNKDLLETIRDVLTIRKLTKEIFHGESKDDDVARNRLMHMTDVWLEALLPK